MTLFILTLGKDLFFAKRCCYAILGMGNRLIKTLPGADGMGSDTEPSHMLREIAGEVMLSGGYDAFLEILKTKGDESEYNKVINEQKEFYAYREQRMAERIKQQLGHR